MTKFWTHKEFEKRRCAAVAKLFDGVHLPAIGHAIDFAEIAYRLGYEAAKRQAKKQDGK